MIRLLLLAALLFAVMLKSFSQIEGLVSDKNKTGIQKVLVTVSDSTGKIIDSTRSDSLGAYAFNGLKPGKYNLEAKASGFQTIIRRNIEITTAPEGTDEGSDTYYAIRLDLILTPLKDQKQ